MIRIVLGMILASATLLAGGPASADTAAPAVTMVQRPVVDGAVRFGHTLVAHPGRWSPAATVSYRWMRDGKVLPGATGHRRTVKAADVGHPLAVLVTARAAGHAPTSIRVRLGYARHRVDVRRTVRYSVRSRGNVPARNLPIFARLAQQTYDDPRGWRGKGVRFVRVPSGGAFTLWLSQAALVPAFSGSCSAEWSCRVGRNVVINLTRWQHASPAWNAAGRALRDYRHMVVNHETGHFLGYHHSGCPRPGALAPVMMQQSKGRDGCRFNPWPTVAELRR